MKLHRAMTMFVIASAAALAMGCADGVKLSSMQEEIHNKADEIHDRAYRCAPRELALASAHEEFGRMELSYGNGRRGEDHITFADENIKDADTKSLNTLCLDPKLQDRDKDGVIDSEDKCPDTPGLKQFDGCPNPDKDGDGVCDPWVSEMGLTNAFPCKGVDSCPDEPGELAYAGCKNPDTDGDGICDQWVAKAKLEKQFERTCKGTDICEKVHGLAEFSGCPNPDSDNDTVCDPWVAEQNLLANFPNCTGSDKCPFEKGLVEENGCPPPRKYIVVTEKEIELKEQFFFATNKTKVLKKSEPLLDEIAEVLKENPNIHIAIEGHTDSSGKYKNNIKLSDGRAKSVLNELAKRGIAKDRMTSKGFGPDRPIDTNDTPEGRANNRRVEIHITQR
ncbi:MAG: OmpA family protein [Proteobacteria bacterium]|nr:OmpA family protein [Pseudomonadota bacterium]MBQ4360334.1 OmpA family protein [Pseudomonadota bacterium]